MIAFYRTGFSLPSADITWCFILFAPDLSDDLIIFLTCIHLYPGSNFNIFCPVASHQHSQYSCLLNREPQISCQEYFIFKITTNNWRSYISLVQNSAIGINNTKVKKITGFGKWISEMTSLSFGVKPRFYGLMWKLILSLCPGHKQIPILPWDSCYNSFSSPCIFYFLGWPYTDIRKHTVDVLPRERNFPGRDFN